jgi:DNA polymerase-3 subunit alpha
MTHADFVHLRVHTAYSLSEGALKIPELVELCRANRMPAVAMTDSGNLFGVFEFAQSCAEAGVQPIIGCVLTVACGEGKGERNAAERDLGLDSLVLLVQDEAGYRNLMHLVSRAFLETESGEPPHLRIDDLDSATAGLIALTGGPAGPVGRRLGEGQRDAAQAVLARLAGLFPGRLYVEIMRHGLEVETACEAGLIDLAYAFELPMVATNDVFFADAEMFEAHDALICINDGAYLSQQERRRFTPEHRFKTASEMRELFADLPEAVDNTLVIARRCAYMPEPRAPILPPFSSTTGVTEAEELRRQAKEGLSTRLKAQVFGAETTEEEREALAKPYFERLDYEIEVIKGMGYPGYFLIVADFVNWARGQGIPVGPGRGSGAGSLVAWSLFITDLDPLRLGLLFERFLNPERVSMPDFDIDFCQDRRDEVIRYVQEKYGRDRVAQIITFGKLQARAVLRDVGRVLEMPYPQVDRICKLVPNNPANPVTLQQAIEGEPQIRLMRDEDETVARLIGIALRLEGLYRHASTHAAGVVIADRPLEELTPLYRDPRSDMPVTQFSMAHVEKAGLVKFDFLGLKTLTVLDRACRLLAGAGAAPGIDLSDPPLDDPRTYEMLSRGDTVGVFQLESSGMRDALRQMRPDCFEDIVALVALFRPGPMDNIPRYVACKHGRERPDHLHPSLEGILRETFGVMIYQEQVMQSAQELAGFTLGKADLLRRAMGKKKKKEMAALKRDFLDGAVARGVEKAQATRIFAQIDKFAGYGFNKSHAAAYALIAYRTAYLKANHPVAFIAASMALELNRTDKLAVFREELNRLGIPLLPPDINRSAANFTVESDKSGTPSVRYALAALKNVGLAAMEALVEERTRNGPFASVSDFAGRVDPHAVNKRQLESLVKAGAFDCLDTNRRKLFKNIEAILGAAGESAKARENGQTDLFFSDAGSGGGSSGKAEWTRLLLAEVEDWPLMERLRHEYEAIGFYLSAHPLDAYESRLKRLGVRRYADLMERLAEGRTARAKLAGTVVAVRERNSAKGRRFAFVQLSDASGVYEVTLFSEVLGHSRELLAAEAPLLVSVEARLEGQQPRLTAQSLRSLDAEVAKEPGGIEVRLESSEALARLREVIAGGGRGRGVIRLRLAADGQEVAIGLPGGYAVSPDLRNAIAALPGIVGVREF